MVYYVFIAASDVRSRKVARMDRHPTQQKILEAAIEIIDDRGEAAVRIQDIQTMVDVTAPSIYHFFGNREGLVIEAQTERLRRSFSESDPGIDAVLASLTSKDQLRQVVRRMLSIFFEPDRAIARQRRMSAMGSAVGRPELAKEFDKALREYAADRAERLEPFKEKGWIQPDVDLFSFNYLVMGMIFGRTFLEIGGDVGPFPEWESMVERATAHILFSDG